MDRGVFAGRYRLESLLGQSAMAEVWLAHDLELDRPVALKLLTPTADRARFQREARAAAALAHPNVTRLYDYGEADGRLFMALEYLPHGTLEERLTRKRRVPDAETAAIASQLAAGLAHAHERGLVHRDVKPANVLFDDEDRPKLADFGIARITGGDTLTEAGTVLGTAAYISPEQAAGESAGPASDVYSFGVLLYRMLTGRLPFESGSPIELAQMHLRAKPPPIELVRPDAPADLAAVATAALAKDPRERPRDGAALAAALGSASPVAAQTSASAETIVMPRGRSPRRRPSLMLALVAVLLLLGAAGTAVAFLVGRHTSNGAPVTTRPPSSSRQRTTPATSTAEQTTQATTTTTASTTAPATTSTTTPTTAPTTTAQTTTAPTTTAAATTTG